MAAESEGLGSRPPVGPGCTFSKRCGGAGGMHVRSARVYHARAQFCHIIIPIYLLVQALRLELECWRFIPLWLCGSCWLKKINPELRRTEHTSRLEHAGMGIALDLAIYS